MIISTLYTIPSIVALLWLVSFSFKVKTQRQKLYMWIQAAEVFYFATYALYISPHTDYEMMVMMDAVNIPVIMALQAMIVVYLYMHLTKARFSPYMLMLLTPAVVFGAIVALLYYMIGFDNAARYVQLYDNGQPMPEEYRSQLFRLYDLFSEDLVNLISGIFMVVILSLCINISRKDGYRWGDAFRFFFRGKATTPSRAISLMFLVEILCLAPLAIMGRKYLMLHPLIGIGLTLLIAIVKHCCSHVEFYSDNCKTVTLYYLSHLKLGAVAPPGDRQESPQSDRIPISKPVKDNTDEDCSTDEMAGNPDTEPIEAEDAHATAKIDIIFEDFQRLMDEEKIYTDEELTLVGLAERMGVGRTTLSTMVNLRFGMPFRDLLNHYRIEAAKKYLRANPTATQESVAFECGFKTASAFNRKFKDETGKTPMMWLIENPQTPQ